MNLSNKQTTKKKSPVKTKTQPSPSIPLHPPKEKHVEEWRTIRIGYEYDIIKAAALGLPQRLELLNKMGEDKWRLIHIDKFDQFYFERVKVL